MSGISILSTDPALHLPVQESSSNHTRSSHRIWRHGRDRFARGRHESSRLSLCVKLHTQLSFACYIKNQPTPQRNLQSIKATKPHTYKVIFVCSTYIPSLHFLERQNPEGVGRESHSAGGSISMTPGGSAPLSWCSCETGRRPSPRYTSSI